MKNAAKEQEANGTSTTTTTETTTESTKEAKEEECMLYIYIYSKYLLNFLLKKNNFLNI